MKSIEKLEENYKKEMALAEKHKQNAADLKKEIELLKGNMINQKARALNFNGAEYDRFIRLLGSDKNTVMEAIKLVLKESGQEMPQTLEKGENEDVHGRKSEEEA